MFKPFKNDYASSWAIHLIMKFLEAILLLNIIKLGQ